jgi:hypothetical protein
MTYFMILTIKTAQIASPEKDIANAINSANDWLFTAVDAYG